MLYYVKCIKFTICLIYLCNDWDSGRDNQPVNFHRNPSRNNLVSTHLYLLCSQILSSLNGEHGKDNITFIMSLDGIVTLDYSNSFWPDSFYGFPECNDGSS